MIETPKRRVGDQVAILIDTGPFDAGDVARVEWVRTVGPAHAPQHEVYVSKDDSAGWIPEDSVGDAPPDERD